MRSVRDFHCPSQATKTEPLGLCCANNAVALRVKRATRLWKLTSLVLHFGASLAAFLDRALTILALYTHGGKLKVRTVAVAVAIVALIVIVLCARWWYFLGSIHGSLPSIRIVNTNASHCLFILSLCVFNKTTNQRNLLTRV